MYCPTPPSSKKRGRNDDDNAKEANDEAATAVNGHVAAGPTARVLTSGGHRAGFDAFMTGFSYLAHLAQSTAKSETDNLLSSGPANELKNKVHLVYKTSPLLIYKSSFAKVSQAHADKYRKLNTTQDTPPSTR